MKKTFIISALLLFTISTNAQKNWFSTYSYSIELLKDARFITEKFTKDIKKSNPTIKFDIKTVIHTTPYLIYFENNTANLPLWEQVIPEQKMFFTDIAGNEKEGKKVFGLFFNGFYLPHELGHAYEYALKGNIMNSYQSEYFANTIAMLWWKKQGQEKSLKLCYKYAKKMWLKLPNPVPDNTTIQDYFRENYEKASQNPYQYGYMQFKQFIYIYEDKSLPDFDTFIKQNLKN